MLDILVYVINVLSRPEYLSSQVAKVAEKVFFRISVMKAIFNNQIIAESKDTIVIEGNHYFPPNSIHEQYFTSSNYTTVCGWKGVAKYKHVIVDGTKNENSCWFYDDPKPAALNIKGYFGFWKGIKVQE